MVPARQVQEALEKFPLLPFPILQLYHILLKERLVAPILVRCIIDSPLGEFGPFKTCEHHFGSLGHNLEECKTLMGTIQGLINNNIIQFENATITDSSPKSYEGQVNVLIKNRGQGGSFITGLPMAPYSHGVSYPSPLLNKGNPGSDISNSSGSTALDLLSVPLSMLFPILLKVKLVELMASKIQPKLSSETYNSKNHCDYHGAMIGHSTDMRELLKQKVQGLIKGFWLELEVHKSTSTRELYIQTILTRKPRSKIALWKLELIRPSSWTTKPCFSKGHPT